MFPSRHTLATLALIILSGTATAAGTQDPVVLSFATVGDSRAEPGPDLNGQDAIWLQNTRAWGRMLREIGQQKPHALFFNGDMIMGYTTDRNALNRQYAYWRGMVTALQEGGTYVVPVPGNHEVQDRYKEGGKTIKKAKVGNEDSWRDNMGDLILDSRRWEAATGRAPAAFDPDNAPPVGGPDPVTTSQRQLSFSFDHAGTHFAIINTDAVGNDGHAPVAWLKADLAAARARGARQLFVFGHKPAFTYHYKADVDNVGFDLDPPHQQAFWQVIEEAGATYFCGHEHIYKLMQPWKAQGGQAWQVMVGSGGSPFEAAPGSTPLKDDRTYAWAQVKVHASGKVEMDTWGFDEHYGPTRRLAHVVLKP